MKLNKIQESIVAVFFEESQEEYERCIKHLEEYQKFWEENLKRDNFFGCIIDRNYKNEKIIVSKCFNESEGIYRISYFSKGEPTMHENFGTIIDIAEKLAGFSLHDDLMIDFQLN